MEVNKRHLLPILIISGIAFLVYSISLPNQFLWDDEVQIVSNKFVHHLDNIPNFFTSGIFYTPGQTLSGGFYRPVLTSTYTFIYVLSKGSPFGFRLFQVLIHTLNSLLVYLIFLQLLKKNYQGQVLFNSSFLAGLTFAIHPAISEAVLFIAGLGEPLFTLFLLTSFLFFSKYTLISCLFFFLALLTKETAVVFFPLILIYSACLARKNQGIFPIFGFLAVLFSYVLLRYQVVGGLPQDLSFPSPIAKSPLSTRLVTIPYEIVYYLSIFIFPYSLSIAQHPLVHLITDIRFWGSCLVILLVFSFFYWLGKSSKSFLVLFFTAWFLLGLVPSLNLFPLSATVAERWLYFPSIGLIGITVVACLYFSTKIKINKKIIVIVLSGYLVLLSFRTILRITNWRNGLTLYKHDLEVNPNSFDLQNNYAVELFRQEKVSQAKKHFEKSIELNPKWWTSYNNLGVVYEREGEFSQAEEYYQKSIKTGNYYLAYENLAKLYLRMGKNSQALKFLEENLKYFPGSATLHKLYAIILYQQARVEEALKEIKIALDFEPSEENYLLFQKISQREKLH